MRELINTPPPESRRSVPPHAPGGRRRARGAGGEGDEVPTHRADEPRQAPRTSSPSDAATYVGRGWAASAWAGVVAPVRTSAESSPARRAPATSTSRRSPTPSVLPPP